jgi:hypothetical protein
MKIVVIGGTGLIGSKTVAILHQGGHEAVAASPNTGVDDWPRVRPEGGAGPGPGRPAARAVTTWRPAGARAEDPGGEPLAKRVRPGMVRRWRHLEHGRAFEPCPRRRRSSSSS